MTNQYRLIRAGAFWEMEDGTRLAWDEDNECFKNLLTGEVYEVIEKTSDDCVIVG